MDLTVNSLANQQDSGQIRASDAGVDPWVNVCATESLSRDQFCSKPQSLRFLQTNNLVLP